MASAGPAHAQEPAEEDKKIEVGDLDMMSLEQLLNVKIVTASSSEEDRALAPANVFVVTRSEIERHGYRSLQDILSSVPGLYLVDDMVNASVAVRGTSGGLGAGTRIVRMMINGTQVNFRPDLTAFLGPEYVPIEVIERVEIAKGPLSALYGANAFLATVNVITRTPKEGISAQVGPRLSTLRHVGYGTSGFVSYLGKHGSALLGFQMGYEDRSGLKLQPTFSDQDRTSSLFSTQSRDDVARPAGAYLRLATVPGYLGTFSLEGGLQQLDSSAEFQYNSPLTHRSRVATRNTWSSARWARTWNDSVTAELSLGYSQGAPTKSHELYLNDSPAFRFLPRYNYKALSGSADLRWSPFSALAIALGADSEYDWQRILYFTQIASVDQGSYAAGERVNVAIDADDDRNATLRSTGAHLEVAGNPLHKLLPNLKLTGNGRVDMIRQGDTRFDPQYSWRAAAAYAFSPKISAKLVGGRAFQAPSAVLMFARPGYGSVGNIVGSTTVPGTDSIKPQTVNSAELSAAFNLLDAVSLEAGIYYQVVDDRIEFVRYARNFRAVNQGQAKNAGVEATLRYTHKVISAYGSIALQRSIVDGKLSTDPSASYPNAFGTVGADLDVPQVYLHLNAEVRAAGRRGATQGNIATNDDEPYSLPAYALLFMTLSTSNLHLLGGDAETRFLVSGRNLIGTRFNEPGYGGFDLPNLGRKVLVEMQLRY